MLEISTIALTVIIIFFGCVFGIGIAFNNKQLKDLGKEELFQAILNASILGIIALIISFLHSFSIICDTSSMPINELNSNILNENLANKISNSYVTKSPNCSIVKLLSVMNALTIQINSIYYEMAYISSLNINIEHLSAMPFKGLSLMLINTEEKMKNISFMYSIILFFSKLSSSLLMSLIDYLLLIGIIFRLFVFSRKFGNFLIALTFSLAIIVPFTIEFFSSMVYSNIVKIKEQLILVSEKMLAIPKIHLGEQAIIEEIAQNSSNIRSISEEFVILIINLESLLYFPSYLLLVSLVILVGIFTYSIYSAISLIKISQTNT